MKTFSRISIITKAFFEISPRQVGLFGLYRFCLNTNIFRWMEKAQRWKNERNYPPDLTFRLFMELPDPDDIQKVIKDSGISRLKGRADQILAKKFRLFGGDAVRLNLKPPGQLKHWTDYEREDGGAVNGEEIEDIKFVWEPARFSWVFILGRAYHLLRDEDYAEAFWGYFELFDRENPFSMGPNWISAQEIALRIFAFCFAGHIFHNSIHSTEERKNRLVKVIANHARRIPLTLMYARAQNNNHLLSEALGLITASHVIPEHPKAGHWRSLGWKWFRKGLLTQISNDGSYIQQSTNYHRLLLHLVIWAAILDQVENSPGPLWSDNDIKSKIRKAVYWLLAMCDPETGRVPNVGPNDGANILPLTDLPWEDFRPVLQTASQNFLGERPFGPGAWDEMGIWLRCGLIEDSMNDSHARDQNNNSHKQNHPAVMKMGNAWGYLRTARFHGRPGHADQLHLDVWWRGINIAQDPGTYLYNGQPPWNNGLTHTGVHNTITIDGKEQMTRAGRFLYLDKALAEVKERTEADDGSWKRIVATHNGYRKMDLQHQRIVTAFKYGVWSIKDTIQPVSKRKIANMHKVRLHWLLPDWQWELINSNGLSFNIKVLSSFGWVNLGIRSISEGNGTEIINRVSVDNYQPTTIRYQLARCGELLDGTGHVSPVMGWFSPTYGQKIPALSVGVLIEDTLPIILVSEWSFPDD